LAVFNGALYAVWGEGSPGVIRVAQYNGNDQSPNWTLVDNGGLNYNLSKIALQPTVEVFNSKLYVAWAEAGSISYKHLFYGQVRVRSFTGSGAWAFEDGGGATGINYAATDTAAQPNLKVFNAVGKLYIAFKEQLPPIGGELRVKVFQGSGTWASADGGTGLTSPNGSVPAMAEYNSLLYVATSVYINGNLVVRVLSYDGSNDASPNWQYADGGTPLNVDPSANANYPQLALLNGELYIAFQEGSTAQQIRVKAYSTSNPTFVPVDGGVPDVGINVNTAANAQFPALFGFNSELYVIWGEGSTGQIMVKAGH
jgi:hypothetical protein